MVTQAEIDIVINARNMATAELAKMKTSLGSLSKDAAGAASNMEKVGSSAGGIGSKIGGAVKALGSFGLAAGGIGALTGVVGGLGNALGLGLANQMEQTRAQMMAFYKDAGVVETELAKVKKEAASTPFAFNEIATAFAQLGPTAKAAGKDTLELTKIAEALAASNPMQGFEGAVFSLKEAVSGDMTSIIERFNLSRSAIKRFKDEGKSDLEAVQAAMAEQGITYDLVAAQSQTMSGRWSTFVDTINEVKMAIATPIFEALKKSLMGMQEGLQSALPTLQRFGEIAGEGIAKGITLLGSAITAAAPAVKNFIAADVVPRVQAFADILISPVLPAVRDVAEALGDLAGAGRRLIDSLGGVGPVLLAVGAALGGLLIITTIAGAIGGMVATVGGLVAAFTAMSAAISPVAAIVAILGGPLTLAIIGIGAAIAVLVLAWTQNWGDIQGKTAAVINTIRPILDALGDRLSEFGRLILPELSEAWQQTSDNIGSIVAGIRSLIEPIFNGIRGFLDAHRTEITTILQGAWDAIVVIVNTVTGIISNTIQFWLNVLQGDWNGAWQNIKNIVDIAWNGIKELITIALGTIPSIITLGMAAVQAVVEGAWNLIKSTVNAAINGEGGVIAIMRAMPGAILAALEGIGTLLYDVGKSLIQGMIDGVKSIGDTLISTVRGFVQGAIDAAWEAIRPGSPSLEGHAMMVNLFEGMISGASDMGGALRDKVMSIVQEAIGGAVNAARDAAGGIAGAIGGVAGAIGGALSGGSSGSGLFTATSSGAIVDMGRQMAAAYGWTGAEFDALNRLWTQESGWNPNAVNPSSGAAGIPQALGHALPPGYAGNPSVQIAWGLDYIRGRYGSPSAALAFEQANGWYGSGGKVKAGWFGMGERGFEVGHLGPDGLTIFPHEMSKALLPLTGGRGFAAGSGSAPGGSKGDNTQAELFAAFAAGTNTPETWAAWTKGMQQIAEYMADEAIAIEEAERQLAQTNLGAELRRFAEWVRQFGDQWLKALVETEGVEAAFQAYHGRSSPSMAMVGAGSIQNPDAVVQRLDQLIVAVEAMTDRPVVISTSAVGEAARQHETEYYRSRH